MIFKLLQNFYILKEKIIILIILYTTVTYIKMTDIFISQFKSISSTSVLQNKRGDDAVPLWVSGVQQNQNQVEATEQRAGQSYVHRQWLVGIVLAFGVSGCQDCGSSVQLTHYTVDRGDDVKKKN